MFHRQSSHYPSVAIRALKVVIEYVRSIACNGVLRMMEYVGSIGCNDVVFVLSFLCAHAVVGLDHRQLYCIFSHHRAS